MSDRGDTSRDVLLRVRVENLTTAGFKQLSEAINLITSSLDSQVAAANRAEIKERELAASLTKLDQAARNLAGLDALISRYKSFNTTLASNEARLEAARKKLADYQEAGKTTEAGLARLTKAHESAVKGLADEKQRYDALGESLRKAGIDTANLAQAEQALNTVAEQTGQGRTKLSAAILDLTRNQRLAREAAIAERAEQERLTVSLRSQADARAKMAGEGQRQYQDALRRNSEAAAVQKREYDAAVAATRKRVDDERAANAAIVADLRTSMQQRVAENKRSNEIIRKDTQQTVADMRASLTGRAGLAPTLTPAPSGGAGGGILSTGPNRGAGAPVGALGLRPYELTNLGYQINDVITGLVSGQNMTQILAQQGGQFIQIFGRAALRWFPLVAVAVAGVTVAVEALTTNLRTLASNREFTALLTANKYAAEQNVGSLTALRKEVHNLGVSWDDAGKAIRTALEANVRPEKMREVVFAAQAMALVTGKTMPEAMADLTAGISGGIAAFDRLLAVYPAIGAKNAEYIRDLFLAGRAQQAQVEILRLVGEAYDKARKEKLSPLDEAVIKLRTSWNTFIDRLGNSSAFDSLITKLTNFLDKLTKAVEWTDRLAANLNNPKFQTFLTVLEKLNTYNPAINIANTIGDAVSGAAGVLAPSPSGGVGRFSVGGNSVNTEELKTLVAILAEASRALPPGYRVEAISTHRPGATIRDTGVPSEHSPGRAIDVRIVDANGQPVPGAMGAGGPMYDILDKAMAAMAAARGVPIAIGSTFRDAGHYSIGGPEAARNAARRGETPDGSASMGVTSGPTGGQSGAGERENRILQDRINLQRVSSREREEELIRQQAIVRLQDQQIHGQAQADAVKKEVDLFKYDRDKSEFELKQQRSKEEIQDGKNRLAIEAGGQKAVENAIKANITNYKELVEIRKGGEAEARAQFAKDEQAAEELRGIRKQIAALDRQVSLKDNSELAKAIRAVNDEYVSIEETLDKRAKNRPDLKEETDQLRQQVQLIKEKRIAQATVGSFEAAAREALTTRNTLTQTYANLEASGDMTIAEKESRTKAAFALTSAEILGAANNMEKFLASAEGLDLPPTKIVLMTARIAELRSQVQYVSPMFMAIKDAVVESFTSGLSSAFNTVGEALGGLIAKTKSWKDVWDSVKSAAISFFAQLLKNIAETILRLEGAKLASSFLSGGSEGGGGFLGKALGFVGSLFGMGGGGEAAIAGTGGLWHQGGVVGHTSAPQRAVQASWFVNAPRYHSGRGAVGLAPDEQAAILQRGEEVLSRSSPRNIMNGGGSSPDINIRSVLLLDRELIPSAMAGTHGEQTVMAHIRQNIGTIRQMVKP